MNKLLQEINANKEKLQNKYLNRQFIQQKCLNCYKCCLDFCYGHRVGLLSVSRWLLVIFFVIASLFPSEMSTRIYLFAASIMSFIIIEILLRVIKSSRRTGTFTYISVAMLLLAQVSGAAFHFISTNYFIPLYKKDQVDNIKIYSEIGYDKTTEEALDYILERMAEVRSNLRNEFHTEPPSISIMLAKNTSEFAHIVKGNFPYTAEDTDDIYKDIPMVTRENTIIVNGKNISEARTSEQNINYQLYYELSHIFYNNYSLNRDMFLKEGFARYFSKKYTGYLRLDENYEDFLLKWRRILEQNSIRKDKNNIPLILGDYTEDKAYDDPTTWEESGNLAYNLLNWMAENYSNKVLLDILSDLGKGRKSDDIFIRITGYDLKGAVWHSVMDDWYRKHEIKLALIKSIPDYNNDYSKYTIFVGSENNRSQVPGDFYSDELINWLNINIPIQTEITIMDPVGRMIFQTQRSKIIYPK